MPPLGLQLALLRMLRPALLAAQQRTMGRALGHTSMVAVVVVAMVVLDVSKVAARRTRRLARFGQVSYFFMVHV